MNTAKLKQAEAAFFALYPQGMDSPEMAAVRKKHKMDELTAFARQSFSAQALSDVPAAAENMIRMASRSTMISLFEKPKFRDMVRLLRADMKADLVASLSDLLHGSEARGFHQMLSILSLHNLAKWPLITVWRCYCCPETDLLYKPTTVKRVIAHFELDGLVYNPRPNYDFFVGYRSAIAAMKQELNPLLSPSGAAFSGFLMMAMDLFDTAGSPTAFPLTGRR